MRKNIKKSATIALSVSLIGSMPAAVPGTVYAAETDVNQPNTVKEENVYATLEKDGSVQEIYVVNAYDLSQDTKVVDYGKYASLKNLSNENAINQNGNEISVDAQKGKFYYQGNLDTKNLPWNIQIRYYLDDKEISGEELAGKSGALRIQIDLTQNQEVDAFFFENYLLQATIALPAEQCTNIAADGATIANMSGEKQILFNVMGGQEKTLTVSADVTDFEMSAISFKGVPMSFDIDVDELDTSALTDKTSELTDGVAALDDGAGKLQDGAKQFQDGLTTYTSGVDTLYSGASALASGVDSLQSGTTNYTDAVESLAAGADTLAAKTENLLALMGNLSEAVNLLENGAAALSDENSGAAAQITEALEEIETGLTQMRTGLNAMNSQAIIPMLQGLEQMEGNMAALESGLSGAGQYMAALQSVQTEYRSEAEMLSGIIQNLSASGTDTADGAASTEEPAVQTEESRETKDGEPQITTTTETVEGQYIQDYTDTTTEETVDEAGNKVIVVTNNIYMTKENTTTITNEMTTTSETIITQKEIVTNQVRSGSSVGNAEQQNTMADAVNNLNVLQNRMNTNAGMLSGVINGSESAPGLTTILTSCQDGMIQAKEALFGEAGTSMRSVLTALQSQLTGENGAIAGIDKMIAGVQQLQIKVSGNEDGSLQNSLGSLNSGLSFLNQNVQKLPEAGTQMITGIGQLQTGLNTLNQNSVNLVSGTVSLQNGAKQLSSGVQTLSDNNKNILNGISELSEGVNTLIDGTQQLSDKTSDIDGQIMDGLKEGLSNFTGQEYEGVSYVSSENENVDAVQFAMQTEVISIAEAEAVEEVQEPRNMWEKFKALFQ